jgi:hypothetical protein
MQSTGTTLRVGRIKEQPACGIAPSLLGKVAIVELDKKLFSPWEQADRDPASSSGGQS